MNTDFPTDPREALETSLTALLLGELPADQAAFLRDAIARDPELARRYERLKQTIELVRIMAKTPATENPAPSPALKLSQQRREELLQHFKTVAPKEFTGNRSPKTSWLIPASIAALLMAVCGVLLLPVLSSSDHMHSARLETQETMRERSLARLAKDRQNASEKQLANSPLDESIRGIGHGLDKKPHFSSFSLPTEAANAESKIVLPTGGQIAQAEKPAAAPEPNAPPLSYDSSALYRNPTPPPKIDPNTGLPINLDSGGGGLGGGGLAGSNPITGPDDFAAFRRRYGLEAGKAADARSAGESLAKNENAVAIDPVTGLPLQIAKAAEVATAGPSTSSIDRYEFAVKPSDSFGQAVNGIEPAFGGRDKDSTGTPWHLSTTLSGFYNDVASTTNNLSAHAAFSPDGARLGTREKFNEGGAGVDASAEVRSKEQAIQAFDAALALNGISVVNVGGKVEKLVPSAQAGQAGAPFLSESNVPQMRVSTETLGRMEQLRGDLGKKLDAQNSGTKPDLHAQADSLKQGLVELDKEIKDAKKLKDSSLAQLQGEPNQTDALASKPALSAPIPQPEMLTRENAFSTFSLNVSDVSFKLAAASLEKGVMPEPAGIRVEEFINAFDYRDPEPVPGVPIAFTCERAQYPFAQNRDLLRFSLKTCAQGRQAGRPLNLVLLLDNSGSMERADRVRIIQEALRVLAAQLQSQDTFSVVTFARTARLWVDGIPGNQAGKVAEEISDLTPQGGTNLEEAMNLAYQTALRHYLPNGVNRVVLLTDGAANLGNVAPDVLKQKVETNRKQGIALDGFGIGWEGYNDDLLEVLTRNGDGRYGFINTPEEAATGFANQLAGALHVAAADVKVQVEFNPSRVTAYRQLGYAKHQLTKEQFRDNTIDAAEIGAAESGNALYVVQVNPHGDGPLATVRVRYKVPGTAEFHEHEWTVPYTGNAVTLQQSSPALRLAATASAFGEWLATNPYTAEVTPDALLGYLNGIPEIYGADSRPKTLEWMIRQAKSLAGK